MENYREATASLRCRAPAQRSCKFFHSPVLIYAMNVPAETVWAVRKKTVAVGSGKGGTGKSTTSLNLAITFARQNLKVGLLDLDPLSNLGTVLDIEHSIYKKHRKPLKAGLPFSAYMEPVLPRLDLIFPNPKIQKEERSGLLKNLVDSLMPEFLKRYDVLLLDLPAGISAEENLVFLPFAEYLLVVTNPEPTAHVSSGGYIKAALQINPDINIFIWHNKYKPGINAGFDSINVIQNYNRYAPAELRVSEKESGAIRSIAFIPHDPSLDLLQNIISPAITVQLKMAETLTILMEKLIDEIVENTELTGNVFLLTKYYIRQNRRIEDSGAYAADLLVYLDGLFGKSDPLGEKEKKFIRKLVREMRTNFLYLSINKALDSLEDSLEQLFDEKRLFSVQGLMRPKLNPEEPVLQVLKDCLESGVTSGAFLKNTAGLLLFYLAFHKLLTSDTILRLFLLFTPFRKTEDGTKVRDRNRQIRCLLDRDKHYHDRYYSLIKKLFPVMLTQMNRAAKSLSCQDLLYYQAGGSLNQQAYIRLLTDLVHDCVNTGLGIASGYKFNIASSAIRKGALELLSRIKKHGGSEITRSR
ncbi:MAG: hypothetical protein E4H36_04720 [Spirochaetales bacterium]|nr:MAG: hypothetical protein E4H36_04720 [Spirochaetales bacterium]